MKTKQPWPRELRSREDTRYAPLVRALRLARWLEGRRYLPAWDAIAEELGVCTRTARRYVAALEAAHWPVPPMRPRLEDVDDVARGGCVASRLRGAVEWTGPGLAERLTS